MIRFARNRLWTLCFLFPLILSATAISADDNGKKHRYRERRHGGDNHYAEKYLKPVSNTTYSEHCSACHFAYQPGLLPSESWRKILQSSEDHFGDTVDLDAEAREEIHAYLTLNAANTSSSKLSQKIMHCLDGQTPLRITDIPYIRKAHHEIGRNVVNRPSVGSLSNCIACHRDADRGIYDDDRVSIPE
ncbi:diheme cytochrome c [Desulfosarcina ovata]|uniref:diheme cytochrome c n=1 Tax=Desulfosarcina ovata TaxID=83564 RepID=UPI0012D35F6D|nr:diheme cytochrome c [Desulfosarcina ovata]